MTLSEQDLKLLNEKGISAEELQNQIQIFESGIPFIHLHAPAIIGSGILKFDEERQQELIAQFDQRGDAQKISKFIPASGAASRMFKALFNFLDSYNPDEESIEDYYNRSGDKDMRVFQEGITQFAFYDSVVSELEETPDSSGQFLYSFVKRLLDENGLNYGFFPKGLLLFHNYKAYASTPFEEHLLEGASYAKNGDVSLLHFTISPQHGKLFDETFDHVKSRVSDKTKTAFEVTYSFQKPATDTLAVTPDNKPFRNKDGSLLFRPGGHGALIENLNEVEADIIFIKNIDNVTIADQLRGTSAWKKVLGGYLMELQAQVFEYAKQLASGEPGMDQLVEIRNFLEMQLNVKLPSDFRAKSIAEQIAILKDKINRPLRICGMVKNEGQPGGGPYWIKDGAGNISLQIVESAQANLEDAQQKEVFMGATHFNPVDIVCSVKDYEGKKYNLLNYVDKKQGFITEKTKEGKDLKALELPGLWNGGMAFWNTVFVEVPSYTFNPVKTVNDLLSPAHQ